MCLHSGEGHLTFTGPVHGKPSLAGVFSAALCQSGPGGAGAGLQADCRLDKHRSIPDPPFYRGRRRNPCQGASFCALTPSSVKLLLTLLLCFISAFLLSVLMLMSFFRKHAQSSMMSLQPSRTSWHRRPISARSAIICLQPYAFSNRSFGLKCECSLCCRGFMSLDVALSPRTLRGATCPGSTHGQLLG